jgi:hypothetical protein
MTQEKKLDSDSDDDAGITAPIGSSPPKPWFPPPPTVPIKDKQSRVRIKEPAKPVEELPSLLIIPPIPIERVPKPDMPARTKSRRKTILERIEGWWDLNLLEAQRLEAQQRQAKSVRIANSIRK